MFHRDNTLVSVFVTSSVQQPAPEEFTAAIAAMNLAKVRKEITLGLIRPPQRLAPYSYALGAEVMPKQDDPEQVEQDGSAFGRLILLHDPQGDEAWDGSMRFVSFIQADVERAVAEDPLLPEVAWSWFEEVFDARHLPISALGGTVTATTSVRYGDIVGPKRANQLELRASWTAKNLELNQHVEAFCEVLSYAAGLPPTGTVALKGIRNKST